VLSSRLAVYFLEGQ